ncbi:hypothetical protein Taro_012707 [Colocasia esculenta]|uniref:CCT domain-containing protein n=1 Tax=Colocasia esculenta TaxID=4460 RepID=A0A843U4P2_COLES|nr:hypothetical protein [Colocasia esculenta]
MAWLEQCEVCGGGGGGFFCCHRDLKQVAGGACPREGGGPSGFVQEFQFFGRPGDGMAWLLGGDVDAAGDGEGMVEDRGAPPVAPAAWDADAQWPALDGGFSVSAGPKAPLAEAGVAASAAYFAGNAVPFFGGGADDSHGDATEAADKATAYSSGKDDSGGMDREARVLRYREKKKRRKFGKQIRYASRKAYAEVRPRIRGRFVKAPDVDGVVSSRPQPQPLPLLPPQLYDAEQQIGMGCLRTFRR